MQTATIILSTLNLIYGIAAFMPFMILAAFSTDSPQAAKSITGKIITYFFMSAPVTAIIASVFSWISLYFGWKDAAFEISLVPAIEFMLFVLFAVYVSRMN